MAQILYNSEPIVLEIPNKIVDNTIVKRKAILTEMVYNQVHKVLSITWEVEHFSQMPDDTYGTSLKSTLAPSKIKISKADNDRLVNPTTGQKLTNTDGVDYMGEYDWFYMMAETQPLMVHNLIRQYGNEIDWDSI